MVWHTVLSLAYCAPRKADCDVIPLSRTNEPPEATLIVSSKIGTAYSHALTINVVVFRKS